MKSSLTGKRRGHRQLQGKEFWNVTRVSVHYLFKHWSGKTKVRLPLSGVRQAVSPYFCSLLPAFWASVRQQWSDALGVIKMESQLLIPHVHRVTCCFWNTMGKVKKDKPEQTAWLKYNPFWSYPSHVFSRGKGMISRDAKLFNLEWHPVISPGTQEKKEAMASTHQKSYISTVQRLW